MTNGWLSDCWIENQLVGYLVLSTPLLLLLHATILLQTMLVVCTCTDRLMDCHLHMIARGSCTPEDHVR